MVSNGWSLVLGKLELKVIILNDQSICGTLVSVQVKFYWNKKSIEQTIYPTGLDLDFFLEVHHHPLKSVCLHQLCAFSHMGLSAL